MSIKNVYEKFVKKDESFKTTKENYLTFVHDERFKILSGNNRIIVLIILLSNFEEHYSISNIFQQWMLISDLNVFESECLCAKKFICYHYQNKQNNNVIYLCSGCRQEFFYGGKKSESFAKKRTNCIECKTDMGMNYIAIKCDPCTLINKCKDCKSNIIDPIKQVICESCKKDIEGKVLEINRDTTIFYNEYIEKKNRWELFERKKDQFNKNRLPLLECNKLKLLEFENNKQISVYNKFIEIFKNHLEQKNINEIKKCCLKFLKIKNEINENEKKILEDKIDFYIHRNIQKKEGYIFCYECFSFNIPEKSKLSICSECL